MAVGMIVLAAGVQVASDHFSLLKDTSSTADLHRNTRVVIQALSLDLRRAGMGVGYKLDGTYGGIERGEFKAGTATFNTAGRQIILKDGTAMTDDIGLRMAGGEVRTVVDYSPGPSGSGQICRSQGIQDDFDNGLDSVMLLSREGLATRSVELTSLADAVCSNHQCAGGCADFEFKLGDYRSDDQAAHASYQSGVMIGDYQKIVWFVVPGADKQGELRRLDATSGGCVSINDAACGGTMADGVESVRVQLYRWDSSTSAWAMINPDQSINTRDRLRFDLEVVTRGATDRRGLKHERVQSKFGNGECVPGPCSGDKLDARREVIRSSVEVRNSGRMLIR